MKFILYIFIIVITANEIFSKDNDSKGYPVTTPQSILNQTAKLLKLVDGAKNGIPNVTEKVSKQLVNLTFIEKTLPGSLSHFESMLKKSNSTDCNEMYEKSRKEVEESLRLQASNLLNVTQESTLKMLNFIEERIQRIANQTKKYAAEAGDCQVNDNSQCELMARYHHDLHLIEHHLRWITHRLENMFGVVIYSLKYKAGITISQKIFKPLVSCIHSTSTTVSPAT